MNGLITTLVALVALAVVVAIPPSRSSLPTARVVDVDAELVDGALVASRSVAFQMVGVSWRSEGGHGGDHGHHAEGSMDLRVETRDGGRWRDAGPLTANEDGPDTNSSEAGNAGRTFSSPLWVGESDAVRLAGDVDELVDVKIHLIQVPPTTAESRVDHDPADHRPDIVTRSQWGARPPAAAPQIEPVTEMAHVHHTVTGGGHQPDDVAAIMRGMQAYHMDARGWNDLGYSFVVDRFGRIWEGRGGGVDRHVVGAHAAGFNSASMGVALLGSFTEAPPTRAALDAAGDVIGWRLGIDGRNPKGRVTLRSAGSPRYRDGAEVRLRRVTGHRATGQTACPGDGTISELGSVRRRAALVARGTAAPFGNLDAVQSELSAEGVGIAVKGWAIDGDRTSPIDVVVTVDGELTARWRADRLRRDVGRAYPRYGPRHGFAGIIDALPGQHRVCVTAVNRGHGFDRNLGCVTDFFAPGAQ